MAKRVKKFAVDLFTSVCAEIILFLINRGKKRKRAAKRTFFAIHIIRISSVGQFINYKTLIIPACKLSFQITSAGIETTS
jgi:hypothetical protein